MPRSLRLVAALVAAVLAASPSRAERVPVRAFTTADGLQRDEVWDIHADSRGFLWILTAEGVVRYDGHAFARIGEGPGSARPHATSLAETPFGLLVASAEGIFRAEPDTTPGGNGRVRWVSAVDSPPQSLVLHVDAAGTVWCGTTRGLARLVRDGRKLVAEEVPLPWPEEPLGRHRVIALASEPDGTLWIGANHAGFVRHPDGRAEVLPRMTEHPDAALRGIVVDPQGRRWLGFSDGLVRLDAEWPRVPPVRLGAGDGLPESQVWSVGWLTDGELWAGTQSGLGILARDASRFRFLTLASGLPDDFGGDIEEDAAGNGWVASESSGALMFPRSGFASFGTDDGLGHERIEQLLQDDRGRLVAYAHGTINVLEDGRFRSFTPNTGLEGGWLGWGWQQVMLRARDGRWWLATARGLLRWPAVDVEELARLPPERTFTMRDGLGDDEVFRIFEDSRGDIWIATFDDRGNVLTRWDRETDALVPEWLDPVRPKTIPTAFCEDLEGRLWVGFYHGMLLRLRLRPDGPPEVTTVKGAPESFVRALSCDEEGRVWAGFTRGGLARIEDPGAETPVVSVMSTPQGLSSETVSCFLHDAEGGTWIGTGRGVDRLDDATRRIDHFGVAEGLPNSFVHVAGRDAEGRPWFGTLRGLSRHEPRAPRRVATPPAWITGVRVAGVARPVSELGERRVVVELAARDRGLAVAFTAPWFVAGTRLRFQRKLDGEAWSEPMLQREVIYDRLSPGTHELRIRAMSPDGSDAGEEAVAVVRVAPPLWRRAWFLVVVAAAVVGAGKLWHDWRVRRLVEIERVRTRIASDLHDDIGAGLTQVALLSELARRGAARGDARTDDTLQRIATVSRELVDSMSDIVWAVDPRHDSLADLVHRMRRFASDAFASRGIAFSFDGPPEERDVPLGADVKRQVYLIFKEAVSNAVQHSAASRAVVRLRVRAAAIELEIEDDGVGFEEIAENTGHGLWNLQARARAVGGTLDVESADGKGTRVRLSVPI